MGQDGGGVSLKSNVSKSVSANEDTGESAAESMSQETEGKWL